MKIIVHSKNNRLISHWFKNPKWFKFGIKNSQNFRETELFTRNRNICEKSKLMPKNNFFGRIVLREIEFFARNRNFCEQSKFLQEIEIDDQNSFFFAINWNYCEKSKFLWNILLFGQIYYRLNITYFTLTSVKWSFGPSTVAISVPEPYQG